MNDAERGESWLIDARRDRHVMIALVARDRALSERAHLAVNGVGVIAELLQFGLNASDDLVGRETGGAVDGLIVLIIRVGIVTPRRVPPAVIPTPPTPIEKDQRQAVVPPPVLIVMMMRIVSVILVGLRGCRGVPAAIFQSRDGLRVEFVFAARDYYGVRGNVAATLLKRIRIRNARTALRMNRRISDGRINERPISASGQRQRPIRSRRGKIMRQTAADRCHCRSTRAVMNNWGRRRRRRWLWCRRAASSAAFRERARSAQ